MATLPQLYEEDIAVLDRCLDQLLRSTEASTALVIDKGGFLICQRGDVQSFDTVTLAALAAGSFAATQTIASIVNEPNFTSLYQQGEEVSMLATSIDQNCVLVVVFRASLSVGAVKYYAVSTTKQVAAQIHSASVRNPGPGLDLSMMNIADTAALFQRKAS